MPPTEGSEAAGDVPDPCAEAPGRGGEPRRNGEVPERFAARGAQRRLDSDTQAMIMRSAACVYVRTKLLSCWR